MNVGIVMPNLTALSAAFFRCLEKTSGVGRWADIRPPPPPPSVCGLRNKAFEQGFELRFYLPHITSLFVLLFDLEGHDIEGSMAPLR